MTEHAPIRRRRGASSTRSRTPRSEVPSTIWAVGAKPLEPTAQWPTPLVSRAVTEFSHPDDSVLLLATPAKMANSRRPRFMTPATKASLATIEGQRRHSESEPLTADRRTSRATATGDDGDVALVLASLLPPESSSLSVVDEIITRAAARLAPGGVLVVLTRSAHTREGVLADPTGYIVSTGQAADLLFLQHIVAVPITGDTVVAPAAEDADRVYHAVAHTDITVLLRP
ncbi:hypothetical protein [Nocardia sp. NPDC059195]|uniref:hypothetical protein n=1 Tax=Nocardia sp. NPDC059195 TaxID=3346765 RepID=UPI0036CCD0C1